MKAILLAAGLGTRLRPITDNIPKCLVSIKGVPLLGVWLKRLKTGGIGPFLVNTHYLDEQVKDFVKSGDFNADVTLVHEPELLGTAGTLKHNLDFFSGQEGMLIHADNYCLANLEEFVSAHYRRPDGCVMTMMTFKTDAPSACGIVELNNEGVVIGFHEKVPNPPGNLANGAIYILSKELVSQFNNRFSCVTDFSTEVIPALVGKIYAYQTDMSLIDIGTVENYNKVK